MSETSQPQAPQDDPEDDALLSADVGHDINAPSEAGEPGDPESGSDPLPDIAGTGS